MSKVEINERRGKAEIFRGGREAENPAPADVPSLVYQGQLCKLTLITHGSSWGGGHSRGHVPLKLVVCLFSRGKSGRNPKRKNWRLEKWVRTLCSEAQRVLSHGSVAVPPLRPMTDRCLPLCFRRIACIWGGRIASIQVDDDVAQICGDIRGLQTQNTGDRTSLSDEPEVPSNVLLRASDKSTIAIIKHCDNYL